MNVMKKARVAAITVIATVLLAGCATAESSDPADANAPSDSSSSSSTYKPALEGDPLIGESFSDRLDGEDVGVEILEVTSPGEFIVGPDTYERDMYDISGDGKATLRKSIVTPEKGDCGYDEALSFVEAYFADDAEASVGKGVLYAPAFEQSLLRAGFAYMPTVDSSLENAQSEAENAKAGLWGSCDDFGV
jgi:hypothetical protein